MVEFKNLIVLSHNCPIIREISEQQHAVVPEEVYPFMGFKIHMTKILPWYYIFCYDHEGNFTSIDLRDTDYEYTREEIQGQDLTSPLGEDR